MISRREALAGTAATVSMLAPSSVLATSTLARPPCLPDECITFEPPGFPQEGSRTLHAEFHNHRLVGGSYDYRRHDATRDQLVGTYRARDFKRAPFPFHWAWHLIGAARFGQSGNERYRRAFFELLCDDRDRFVISDDIVGTLQVQLLAGPLVFERNSEWLTVSGYGSDSTLKVRRRDGIGI